MAKLVATVYVTDPDTHQTIALTAGTEPEPHLAALVANPAAWEDGKLPAAAETTAGSPEDDDADTKPAAKRAARKPARGRNAAGEGTSGE